MTDRDDVFDVVVVGGGSAGCVVAARLAEHPSRSVLLLESGPDLRADTPAVQRDGWRIQLDHDWGYASEPDRRGEVARLRRGKLLGGTSWLTRFAVRGSQVDFDGWRDRGNAGWAFDDVLPYFNRLETDLDFGDRPWHGREGPIPVGRYLDAEPTEVVAATLVAMEASGFPVVEDHNRPGAVGVGRMPMSSRDGIRVTTADAYLPLEGAPSNLTIRADTNVDAVVLDAGRATGVRLADGSVLRAGRVVVCAGTYGSPAVLLRSGIGPPEHLRSLGIPVRVGLAGVGENLADHPSVELELGYEGIGRDAPNLHAIGTFASEGRSSASAPDLMLWVADPQGNPPAFSIEAVLLKPDSRGALRLRSPDPAEAPSIRLPGLEDPDDVERLVVGFRLASAVADHPEVRRSCGGSLETIADEELRAWIRETAYSIPHVVGTCAMGSSPEDGAVVDPLGSVHGVEGLSVIDASIIPEPPSGFPHVITIMIAERLAELLAATF